MFKRLIPFIGLTLFLAACGTGVAPLTVSELTPADGAENVAVDVVLSATFDEAIDPDTLAGAFTLAADGGSDVAGTAALSGDGLTATFTPDADLAFSTTYTATIAGTVATTSGTTLGGAASWSFTTAAPAALTGSDYETPDGYVEVGTAVDLAATTSGGEGVVTFALDSGALPDGVTLNTATGAIAGSPTVTGTFTGAIVASDEAGGSVTLAFDILVVEPYEGGSYATYAEPSNVETAISIDSPFTGGHGTVTYEITDGALPAAFTTQPLDAIEYPDYTDGTYELSVDTATGALSGFTGAVGTFTGTVTGTDELGRTATATFELDLGFDLAYVGGTELTVGPEASVVVNGDKVRVNGVPTLGLPDDFTDLFFTLTLDTTASSGDVLQSDFAVNESDGTISKVYVNGTTSPATWVYDVTVQAGVITDPGEPTESVDPAPDSTPSAPVTFTFTYDETPL